MIEPTVIRMDKQYLGTDELAVEFYSCHRCGFERVPHATKNALEWDSTVDSLDALTAKYCPGCGRPVEWV